MKKETRLKKYNIQDISWQYENNSPVGLIGKYHFELFYKGQLVYYLNTKPLNINLFDYLQNGSDTSVKN